MTNDQVDRMIAHHDQLLNEMIKQNIAIGQQNIALGQRIDSVNQQMAQQNIALGQRIDSVNQQLGQRIDTLGQRLDSTIQAMAQQNALTNQRVDLFLQNMATWREEIREQQAQILTIHGQIMEKIEHLSDEMRAKIGFQQ